RQEVTQTLEKLLDEEVWPNAYAAAVSAYLVWAEREQAITKLVQVLSRDPGQGDVVKALVDLKDKRAIVPMAAGLKQYRSGGQSIKGLIEFGPAAEPEVMKYLSFDDTQVRARAAEVLKSIGTSASLDALATASKQEVFADPKRAIDGAIAAIQAREKNAVA